MGRIFGTDGVRGIAGTELTVELAVDLGRAAAMVMADKIGGRPLFLIGKDTRVSSDMLEAAVAAGICSVGGDVQLLGVIPTPAVAYLAKRYGAAAGVVISASHNPYPYNGIKFFGGDGFKLTDEQEEEIESIILDHTRVFTLVEGDAVGRISRTERAKEDYVTYLASLVQWDLRGMRVAVDCSNGSASATIHDLLGALKVKATYFHDQPDGLNINTNCGSTHLDQFAELVRQGEYDLGVAFDGDADRCLAVDGAGNPLDGDVLLTIFGEYLRDRGALRQNRIVVTVMSNMGFFRYAEEHGISTECTKVGDRYVLERMLQTGSNLGGEQSGHITFLDHMTTGDGQLTALMLLQAVKASGRSLSVLRRRMTQYPQVLENCRLTSQQKAAFARCEPVQQAIAQQQERLGKRGRVLVRLSGTEPLVRVMVEGEDRAEIEQVAAELVEAIRQNL